MGILYRFTIRVVLYYFDSVKKDLIYSPYAIVLDYIISALQATFMNRDHIITDVYR